jgi:hypothetical protein
MSVPGYDVMFGKLSLRGLFDDYFMQRGGIDTRFVLKAKEDPRLQLAATVSIHAIFATKHKQKFILVRPI